MTPMAGKNDLRGRLDEQVWQRLILDTSLTPLSSHGPHRVH
ncbi:MAG: hypothetical protein Q7J84_12530 [Sulfuricaulis sp.]|nr:hypothetical protein [Sulfuricaulis sp.]